MVNEEMRAKNCLDKYSIDGRNMVNIGVLNARDNSSAGSLLQVCENDEDGFFKQSVGKLPILFTR